MHDDFYDHLYSGGWGQSREPLHEGGRLSHLVFLDGRLVDAWSDDVRDSAYAQLARTYDEERRPQLVQSPPPPPRHLQVLAWLDSIVGGREALLALAPDHGMPLLREDLDPTADEPWLVVDELLGDVCDELLSPDLAPPMRRCLLLLREVAPWLPERTSAAKIAAGIVWLVGKANAAIGPAGPVTQISIATQLGVDTLTACGNTVSGHVRRLGWGASPPYPHPGPALFVTGRAELLSARVVADLVLLRDDAFAEEAAVLPAKAES